MKNYRKLSSIIVALALSTGMALTASAQSASGDSGGGKTASDPTGMSKDNTFTGWIHNFGAKNQGRISRKAYMDESARRWDSADKTKKGLTYDEISRTYGYSGTGMGGPTPHSAQEKAGITR
ncbi:MAG: hypothetical protein ABI831_21725 [Betaproteobacteria bacterium]